MPFTFKQFHIDDSHCGMPVSTDGVILGAWAALPDTQKIPTAQLLDIGAGSGLLSLMLAQRMNNQDCKISAVELEDGAAVDCQQNFSQSSWSEQLSLHHMSIQQFLLEHQQKRCALFDTIICNPPYFEHGPQSDSSQRATARHTNQLSFKTLLSHIQQLMTPSGQASLIIPQQSEAGIMQALDDTQLSLSERTSIRTVENKSPSRILLQLSHQASFHRLIHSDLIIADKQGQYTPEMSQLCRDFYLKL
ncbi:methyltransferase [Shewanella sp. MMG014]|uniref:tRNA1(Val) (adenine(37)-N6)-methyltransferase n=1 Tax=Shewanella sp. MMG014 TaxID=2822691 RepID=UPI001B35875E|nr:methyltransferase [Shewanella sp. MMG014]MBQ4889690.1 methyltransferase [Shewanella sp. MMG014]